MSMTSNNLVLSEILPAYLDFQHGNQQVRLLNIIIFSGIVINSKMPGIKLYNVFTLTILLEQPHLATDSIGSYKNSGYPATR